MKLTLALLVLAIISFIGTSSAQTCDCYTYWVCDGEAEPVYPDCITSPPEYFGPGVVVPGNSGSPFGYLVHSNVSDQAYRFVGANCVQQLQFGDCPSEIVSLRNDFSARFDCEGNALCVSSNVVAAPADLLNYTVDKGSETNPVDCSCVDETSCTIPETTAPTCAPSAGPEIPLDEDDWCGIGGFTFTADPPTLHLTHDINNEIAAAYFNHTFDFTNGFTLSARIHIQAATSDTADGFVFIIQQDPLGCDAVGAAGEGIGYAASPIISAPGIVRAFAVEFDDYRNGNLGDPSSDHIAVQASADITAQVDPDHGSAISSVVAPVQVDIAPNGGSSWVHDVTVTYVQATQTLTVIFNGVTLINTNIGDRFDRLNLNDAYFGYTSSTGGSREAVQVTDMSFSVL